MRLEQVTIGVTGLLTAAVAMMNQPRQGTATAQRHLEGVCDQRGIDSAAHRPFHHFVRIELFPNKLPGRLASKNTMEGANQWVL